MAYGRAERPRRRALGVDVDPLVIAGGVREAVDPVLVDDGKASALYGPVRSIPTTYVIGKDSKIVKMYIGARDKATFEGDIKGLLQ